MGCSSAISDFMAAATAPTAGVRTWHGFTIPRTGWECLMAIAMPAGVLAAVVSALRRVIAGTTPEAPLSTAGDPATLVPIWQAAAGKWKRIAACRPGLRGEA